MALLKKALFLLLALVMEAHSESTASPGDEIYTSLSEADPGLGSDKSPSDLIFVIDRPGRGTAYMPGFQRMLGFVQSFLWGMTVGADSTRVALVVNDRSGCTVWLNDVPSGEITKCGVVYMLRRLRQKSSLGSMDGDGKTCDDPLSAAATIAKSGRSDVPKIVTVMAYGVSPGLQSAPDQTVEALRNLTFASWNTTERGWQTQVYGLGVGEANMDVIKRTASPGNKHWTYLKTFRDLERLVLRLEQFDVSDGNIWKKAASYQWSRDATQTEFACSKTCDNNAQCSCSLITGQTLCTCLAGYFGNGEKCTPCPKGTYKDATTARRHCDPCPAHMGTRVKGATSVNQCQVGMERVVEKGLKRCLEPSRVAHAYTFGVKALISAGVHDTGEPCSNTAGTSCHFQCRPGLRIIGLPGLLCQWDGNWTGLLPRCVWNTDTDCGTLDEIGQQDPNGFTTYVNNIPVSNLRNPKHRQRPSSRRDRQDLIGHFPGSRDRELNIGSTHTRQGDVLQVDCPTSWRLLGDAERTCSHGVWSATPAKCVDVRCPPVPVTEGLIVSPRVCSEEWQTPGVKCLLTCGSGYRLVGQANITCGDNRRWISNDVEPATDEILGICLDVEPPSITCRQNITMNLPHEDQAMLRWEDVSPTVTDNSYHVTVTSPDIPGSPFPVYFGHQTIRFEARDKNHTVSCSLGVLLKDPRVHAINCPTQEMSVYTLHNVDRLVLPEIRFAIVEGNTEEPVDHLCSPANHSVQSVGHHQVVCGAYNSKGPLGGECWFNISIRRMCPHRPPPLHGSLSCSPTNSSRLSCTVSCDPGYQFHEPPEQVYICDLSGRWLKHRLWPDCSSFYSRSGAMMDATYSASRLLFNASDCLARKLSIKAQALTLVRTVLNEQCDGLQRCSLVKLKLTCFDLGSEEEYQDDLEDDQDFPELIYDFKPVLNYTIKAASASNYSMELNLDLLDRVQAELNPVLTNFTLQAGESSHRIYGVDCTLGYQPLADILCVACPPGTAWNSRLARCIACPIGRYQPDEAQTLCNMCPTNTFTESMGAQNASQCVARCEPGHWSPTSLAPCHPCPKGHFQREPSATFCLSCPKGETTDDVGNTEEIGCYETCERGTSGWGGKKPFCDPCPLDTYQPLRGQEECLPLGHMLDPGFKLCNQTSFMCYNGGECRDPVGLDTGTTCQCQPGYTGFNCEELDLNFCPQPYACPSTPLVTGPMTNWKRCSKGGETPAPFWQYQDPCQSVQCHHGGTCLNSNETSSYECYCPLGFSGPLCKDPVLLCHGTPCIHGECDLGMCQCDVGYAGPSCDVSIDPCWFGPANEGCDPENPKDPCLSQPCSLGSTCFAKRDGKYVCKCQPGKTGAHCSEELSLDLDMEYDLEPRLGWDVTLPAEFMPSLTAMTLALWLRPTPTVSSFTIITFETSNETEADFVNKDLSHLTFGLKQTEQLNIQFFNETVKTGVIIPSAVWTHLCFVWVHASGSWQVFVNGTLARTGKFSTRGHSIPENTFVTVAPRNTTLSDWMIFLGRVSQFNIFSDALSTAQIQDLANTAACNHSYHGDVMSWTNVIPYAFVRKSSLCLDVNECWFPRQFPCLPPTDICVDKLGSYDCIKPRDQGQSQWKIWLEGIGIATATFLVIATLFTLMYIRRKRRRNRERSSSQPGVQMRQTTSIQGHAIGSRGELSRGGDTTRPTSAERDNRSPIVRPPGRRSGRRNFFKRKQTTDYTRGTILAADGLEETVIFDQTDINEGAEASSSHADETDGNRDSVMQSSRQDFVTNANYRLPHHEHVQDFTDREVPTRSESRDEPAPLTFRSATPRGISNPLDFLRSKMPSLSFGRQMMARPIAYKHLREVPGASDHLGWDAAGEEDTGARALEDPYMVSPDDGGQELYTDNDNS